MIAGGSGFGYWGKTFWMIRCQTLYVTTIFGIAKAEIGSLSTFRNPLNIKRGKQYEEKIKYIRDNVLYDDNTKVFVFKPLASGEYTFEISSSFDTYIYVIDPRSTDQLVEEEDYNDDSEDSMDARLTVYLEANVQYFVIYSDYAPNDMFESYDVRIDITKED